jgi:hypothetical protein
VTYFRTEGGARVSPREADSIGGKPRTSVPASNLAEMGLRFAVDAVLLPYTVVTTGRRIVMKTEQVLDTAHLTLTTMQPAVKALDAAIEAGAIEEIVLAARRLRQGVETLDAIRAKADELAVGPTMDLMNEVVNRFEEDVFPALVSLPTAVNDMAALRVAIERLVAVLDLLAAQMAALPGAGLVRKTVGPLLAGAGDVARTLAEQRADQRRAAAAPHAPGSADESGDPAPVNPPAKHVGSPAEENRSP